MKNLRVGKSEIIKHFDKSIADNLLTLARVNRYESGYETGMTKNKKGYMYDMASFDLDMMILLQEKKIKITTSNHHKKMKRTLERLLKIKKGLEDV